MKQCHVDFAFRSAIRGEGRARILRSSRDGRVAIGYRLLYVNHPWGWRALGHLTLLGVGHVSGFVISQNWSKLETLLFFFPPW